MEKLGLNKIRELFLSFYEGKEHYKRNSFSLVPQNDKSLLLINSGMAPLKEYFAGLKKPPSKRMTTCQKCIRTADIENVGITSRHGTFFEMLGSFSFGDYFKEESITWGWEFITEILKMPEDKLWITVYYEDFEAYNIWKNKIGISESKIVKLGKEDNFWEIGIGPCGPCSEIYFDRGESYGCDNVNCKPGCDCDRYVEFWNHVFTQFSKQEDGSYKKLINPNIDTGMGLERIACIMQNVDSIFDIDTIRKILDKVCEIANIQYFDGKKEEDTSIRIITDHIRSATFMIGDTIMPSNEGRGYVLRRLIRRAIRHGKKIGIDRPFLSELVDIVIDSADNAYPELEDQRIFIKKIITQEEDRFSKTLNQGLSIIESYINEMDKDNIKKLDGEKVFKLHDTYGFPFEITKEIINEQGYEIDVKEFDLCMDRQKNLGKSDASKIDSAWQESKIDYLFSEKTCFTGYEKVTSEGKVNAIFCEKQELDKLVEGDIGNVILDKTPFYARGGGQSSDIGYICGDSFKAKVINVVKYKETFAHEVIIVSGVLQRADSVISYINENYRNNSARNHTCTHILHKTLRDVLGDHVQQAGSSVDNTGLRFDFSHYEALDKETLDKIQSIVNDKIDEFLNVTCKEISIEEAKAQGAIGLFDDKYGDVVRVISIGDFSLELCGGIHVENSGQIGAFKILNESGIAAGVRRIEAATGSRLLDLLIEKEDIIHKAAKLIKSDNNALTDKLKLIIEENHNMSKELESLRKQGLNSLSEDLIKESRKVNEINLLCKSFKDMELFDVRNISDELKNKYENLIMIFAIEKNGKVSLMVSITNDLVNKGYHAGNMIKELAKIAGGGGGGKADMAQAGIKDLEKLPELFKKAETFLNV